MVRYQWLIEGFSSERWLIESSLSLKHILVGIFCSEVPQVITEVWPPWAICWLPVLYFDSTLYPSTSPPQGILQPQFIFRTTGGSTLIGSGHSGSCHRISSPWSWWFKMFPIHIMHNHGNRKVGGRGPAGDRRMIKSQVECNTMSTFWDRFVRSAYIVMLWPTGRIQKNPSWVLVLK